MLCSNILATYYTASLKASLLPDLRITSDVFNGSNKTGVLLVDSYFQLLENRSTNQSFEDSNNNASSNI